VVITNAGADLTYQPTVNYCNDGTPTDNFTYTLAGGNTATVAVTVTCVNDISDAVNDTATVLEDAAATAINVRGNDTDIDSAVELITAVTQPANGTVVITNAGADLTYQPNANYCNGGTPTDNFTYTLSGSDTATVAVTVTCINDAPSFTASNPPAVALNSGAQSLAGWAVFNPGPNEAGQTVIQYNVSNATSCGTLLSAGPSVNAAGTLAYTPALNQSGTCTFDVVVQDNGGTTNGGVNTSPVQNFTITVNNGVTVTINQAVGQTDPTSNTPINFTVVFGASVANFDSADVTLSGSATGAPTTAVVTGAGTTYNVEVSGMVGSGLVTVTIPAGVASDITGNPNTQSTGDGTVTYDTTGPIVLFNTNTIPADGSTVQGGPTKITIAFNENLRDDASNPGGAEYLPNYLLVGYGADLTLDANTNCVNRVQGDDVNFSIDTASFVGNPGAGTYITTLGINGGTPLPLGSYALFVCGTTSITDLAGNELNNGTADTVIDFRVAQATAVIPKTGFAMNTVTNLPIQPEGLAYASTDIWMEIPSLGVKTSIVGVTKTSSGWDVTWLDRNAGWLEGSAYPTWSGNSVVTAHVWDALNKPGPFARLKELKYGDQVKIHAFGQVYTYEVRETISISPTNATAMLKHQEKSWLTLVTCEGFQELTKDYSSRRLVRAVLVSVTAEK
jgi:LPXTG-site transpeptidase (sortase) family protein